MSLHTSGHTGHFSTFHVQKLFNDQLQVHFIFDLFLRAFCHIYSFVWGWIYYIYIFPYLCFFFRSTFLFLQRSSLQWCHYRTWKYPTTFYFGSSRTDWFRIVIPLRETEQTKDTCFYHYIYIEDLQLCYVCACVPSSVYWGWGWHPAYTWLQIKGLGLLLSPPGERGHRVSPELVW